MKRNTKIILFSTAFLISLLMFSVVFIPQGELRSKLLIFQLWGILLFLFTLIALVINFITYLAKNNKIIKMAIWIGAIVAIPLFWSIYHLELGLNNNERGICPPHPKDNQLRVDDRQPICDRFYEAGLKDGDEWTKGLTCVNGVYSDTNYRCITYPLGFRESEAGFIIFWWVILAEFYGILAGIIIGGIVSKLKKRSV